MTNKTKSGFTLIELTIAIAIVGVILAVSFISFNTTKQKSRDAKRVADITQIQNALNFYVRDEGKYPDSLNFGSELVGSSSKQTYISKIPQNPKPRNDGDCADSEYSYQVTEAGNNYKIDFCLSGATGDLSSGAKQATAQGITSNVSSVDSFTITASSAAHGIISPNGRTNKESGGNQNYTITPNPGYSIADVLVDNISVGAVSSYGFNNITTNHTISATFNINSYNLTYTAGANGSITGTLSQIISGGANGTQVTAVANPGYSFEKWSDNSTANPRTDTNVVNNISVTASFVPAVSSYTLTYTAGSNGSITGVSPQTVNHGANGSAVTAVAGNGYHFVNWSDGSTTNPRTDTNVNGNISVTANFDINQYTLTYTAGSNGSITGISPQTVNHDANGSAVTAVPNTDYLFVNWSDGSTTNPRTDTNVNGNISVTANFTAWVCGTNPLIDSRDSKSYLTTSINSKCWMAQNLAYLPSVVPSATGSETVSYYYVYGYQGTDVATAKATSTFTNYGVLYNYTAALTTCPSGWSIPTEAQWTALETYLTNNGHSGYEGRAIKASAASSPISWNGTNNFNFTAIPGGRRYHLSGGTFNNQATYAYFWTATNFDTSNANYKYLSSLSPINSSYYNKAAGFSIRCLKN